MENKEYIKRSIRIPKELNKKLIEKGTEYNITVNQLILNLLGDLLGVKIDQNRRRGIHIRKSEEKSK